MVEAISKEIVLQQDYLKNKSLETIYFGGGTPSLLDEKDLQNIFETIHHTFDLASNTEITLEANPDDLNTETLKIFKNLGFNRLSIGIQSFDEAHLQYLNRVHTALEAEDCVKTAQDIGFENLSIDLIYAIPSPNHLILEKDLEKATAFDIPHISAYCLTIEEKTTFGTWLRKNQIKQIEEDFASEQFEILVNFLEEKKFEQYEISNFAKNGKYSLHNTNYWKKGDYLGIGPSAHSYNQSTRQHNIANNQKYIQEISRNNVPFEKEILSINDQINEYLLTSLRTIWGCDLNRIKNEFGFDFFKLNQKEIEYYIDKECLIIENNLLKLTKKGKLLADKISSDLFLIG